MFLPHLLFIAVLFSFSAVSQAADPAAVVQEDETLKESVKTNPIDKTEGQAVLTEQFQARSPFQTMANVPHTMKEIEQTSGTWTGRDQLASHGAQFFVTYTSDIAGNPVGGINPNGFTYADMFSFGCLLETEKLFGWKGGSFTMSAIQYNGTSLTLKNVGNQFAVQQSYAGQGISFYELFYEQKFFEDHVSTSLGRIVPGDEFDTSPLYWLYMNAAIDGTPQSLGVNEKLSFYASATWGSLLKVDLPGSTVARLGVYQITKSGPNGLNWDFYSDDGVILLAQYGWNPEFFKPAASSTASNSSVPRATGGSSKNPITSNQLSKNPVAAPAPKGFQGHYWMGGYYSSNERNQFTSTQNVSNAYGLYWHVDQSVYQPSLVDHSGLVLWSAYVLCPQQNISLMPFQANAGAIYTGLIPGRRNDSTVFGVAYGNFSTDYASALQQAGLGAPTYELVYEFGYRINLTDTAYIQPDLQWIINPGGAGDIPNALVIGAQMGVTF